MSSDVETPHPDLFADLHFEQGPIRSDVAPAPAIPAIETAPASKDPECEKRKQRLARPRRREAPTKAPGPAQGPAAGPGHSVANEHYGVAHLSVRQLAERFSVSVPTIWRWSANDDGFPKPVVLSPGTTRWALHEILAFEQCRRGR